jgi:putative pyruvate formate lyase activating enzyme
MTYPAAYRLLYESGEIQRRIDTARQILACCTLCPRQCSVDRLAGNLGVCQTGEWAVVADFAPHFGEERPLVGENGSGTIFFAHCNLLCLFCQNFEISHHGLGTPVTDRQLADMMLHLQNQGCHNINFVTPTHVVPQILAALHSAIERGLKVPLVYNCSGYETLETLQLLDGIIDIYMPDFKFWKSESADLYTDAPDYQERTRAAIREMHRQVGDLCLDEKGLARRGLLIRHLVMPGGLDETKEILRFIAREVSPDSYVNIMDQYHPCGRANDYPPLDRPLTAKEYQQALEIAVRAGITRLDKRDFPDLLQRLYRIHER